MEAPELVAATGGELVDVAAATTIAAAAVVCMYFPFGSGWVPPVGLSRGGGVGRSPFGARFAGVGRWCDIRWGPGQKNAILAAFGFLR